MPRGQYRVPWSWPEQIREDIRENIRRARRELAVDTVGVPGYIPGPGVGGESGYWQRISGVLSPSDPTDDLAVGGLDSSAPFSVDLTGASRMLGMTHTHSADAGYSLGSWALTADPTLGADRTIQAGRFVTTWSGVKGAHDILINGLVANAYLSADGKAAAGVATTGYVTGATDASEGAIGVSAIVRFQDYTGASAEGIGVRSIPLLDGTGDGNCAKLMNFQAATPAVAGGSTVSATIHRGLQVDALLPYSANGQSRHGIYIATIPDPGGYSSTSTASIRIADESGAARGGLLFGADVTLYRSAANMLKTDDALSIAGMKSGATQAAAGAAADELWYTVSHATLPDYVVMIGA